MRPIYIGDKINLDVTVYFDGFHGDTNLTVIYGGLDKAPTP
jgi:methionine aminopeptidase